MSSCKLYVNRIIIIIIIIRCWSFGVDRKCIWLYIYNAKTKRSFRLFGKYKKIYIYIYILKKKKAIKQKKKKTDHFWRLNKCIESRQWISDTKYL